MSVVGTHSPIFPLLPAHLREPIRQIAAAMKLDPEVVVAGWLAYDEIRRLPAPDRVKAVAVVVRLYEMARDIGDPA